MTDIDLDGFSDVLKSFIDNFERDFPLCKLIRHGNFIKFDVTYTESCAISSTDAVVRIEKFYRAFFNNPNDHDNNSNHTIRIFKYDEYRFILLSE